MRKIYFTAIILFVCNLTFGQSFFEPCTYRGAFAPAPVAMWTDNWTDWDPQNTVHSSPTVTVTTSITTNTTWTSNNVYLLSGQIYVKNGATLTIQPGTVILGDKAAVGGGLFITQGSKLMAVGTEAQPIIFTSNQAAGLRSAGDWGGVIIMGKGANNSAGGVANIEGILASPDTQFGGGVSPDPADNSGVLQYVRIEFAGYIYAVNKEINGLTLGAVGSGTTIDHIQVSFSNDDAYEWFGGSVNCRYLVSYRNLDDDFDTDNGFSGKVQYGLVVRDPNIADNPSVSTSEGFESDNDAAGSTNAPQTSATFSNITLVGPLRGNTAATVATGFRRGARIRRNSGLKIYNSIFMDFVRGIHIDGALCEANATSGALKYQQNLVAGYTSTKSVEVNSGSTFDIKTWFGTSNNDSLASSANILVTPYDYLAPDYRPISGSVALNNISYLDAGITSNVLFAPVVTSTIEYCVNETASALTATALSGNTLNWYLASTGGSPVSAPTPSTLVAGSYNFYVSQVGMYNLESERSMITVIVHDNPTAPVITASGPTSFCTGSSITLTSNQSTGNVWSTTATSNVITVSNSNTYTVTYTDANNCSSTSLPVVTNVSLAPVPTITASGPLTFCDGDSVILVSTAGDSYLWSDASVNDSLVVYVAGNYNVTTTNTDACLGVGLSSNSVVVVNNNPVAMAGFSTAGNIVTFNVTGSTGATSYSWDFGDGNNSSQASPVHAYVGNASYIVLLTAINGNCTDVYELTVVISVGMEEMSSFEQVGLYPNPVKDEANLVLELKENTAVEINVYDLSGKIVSTVYNGTLNSGKNELKINTSDLQDGIYYTRINSNNSVKIIKMNVLR